MAEGVKYIKVAKIDGDGVDQTISLQSLTEITIPYSTGNVTYDILSISEQLNYFLYSVDNPNIEHADRASLKYDVTASLNNILVGFGAPVTNPRTAKLTTITDNQEFLEDFEDGHSSQIATQYKFKTYPQKNISVQASGSLSGLTSDDHKIFLTLNNTEIGNSITAAGSGEKLFNISASINSGSLSPNSEIRLKLQNLDTFATPSCAFSSSARFFISSTDASGPTVETIPEPFFTQNFNKSLDCQPTLNNAINSRQNSIYQKIDYSSGVYIPTNFDSLISGSALKAQIPDSNYSSLKHINPRYLGSKNQSSNFNTYNSDAGTSSFGTPINIGTYGRTPSVSVLDANIYEFVYGGGTTPEILGWGGFKLGNILQVSGKDSARIIKGSEGLGRSKFINYRKSISLSVASQYRSILGDDGATILTPPVSVATSSIGDNHFWLTPQTYSDYYQILNSNNPTNHEISVTLYPNPTAGADPTIPKTTKVVTTDWGVPTKSRFALTSSNAVDVTDGTRTSKNYGFVKDTYPIIFLFKNQKISKVTTDNNGFYQSSDLVKPTLNEALSRINKELNDGERWFITLFDEFEFPNNQGDYNSRLTSGSLTPYNVGYSGSNADGNYSDPLAYKGVYEIIGTRDEPGFSGHYSFLYLDKPLYGDRNIGGNNEANTPLFPYQGFGSIGGPSLGMLMWKARATGKNEFIMVQDEVTGGVAEGAFISKFATQDILDNFDYITKTYGINT